MSNIQKISDKLPSAFSEFAGAMDVADEFSGGVGASVATLSIKGRTFSIRKGGETTPITNEDGDPVSSLRVIILRGRAKPSKEYYSAVYSADNEGAPVCASVDGEKPDAGVPEPQAKSCAVCPKNAWGSRVTENGASKGKACQDKRRIAVVSPQSIAEDDDPEPLLLRVPPDSLKALAEYANKLKRHGLQPFMVVTKLGFEAGLSYPKLTFTPVASISDDEVARKVVALRQSEQVEELLDVGSTTVAESEGAAAPKAEETRPPMEKPSSVFDGAGDDEAPAKPAKSKGGKGKSKQAAAPAPEPADEAEDFDLGSVKEAPEAKAEEPAEPAPTDDAPLVGDFDEMFGAAGLKDNTNVGTDDDGDEAEDSEEGDGSHDGIDDLLGSIR